MSHLAGLPNQTQSENPSIPLLWRLSRSRGGVPVNPNLNLKTSGSSYLGWIPCLPKAASPDPGSDPAQSRAGHRCRRRGHGPVLSPAVHRYR